MLSNHPFKMGGLLSIMANYILSKGALLLINGYNSELLLAFFLAFLYVITPISMTG